MINYEKYENSIPEWTLHSLKSYIESSIPTGGFLKSVLENNLMESFNRADDENKEAISSIVKFLFNEAPANCFGSSERVEEWLDSSA